MSSPGKIQKVTAFITRPGSQGLELLIFRHPTAGFQITAGTVEPGEVPADAVLREVEEETGLTHVRLLAQIGVTEQVFEPPLVVLLHQTKVYAQPNVDSFDWAHFPRGLIGNALRKQDGFTQLDYQEPDNLADPQFTTYQITGWVPDDCLCSRIERHYFHLELIGAAPDQWQQKADYHTFDFSWAPVDRLPDFVYPQQQWVPIIMARLREMGAIDQ